MSTSARHCYESSYKPPFDVEEMSLYKEYSDLKEKTMKIDLEKDIEQIIENLVELNEKATLMQEEIAFLQRKVEMLEKGLAETSAHTTKYGRVIM